MKKILLSLAIIIIFHTSVFSQTYDALQPPNTYRNADNPYYWQNRKPHPTYWQQDVHYTIKANIDEKTDIITAVEELVYWNNSPDELNFVFFHLFQNAFQPDSYYDKLHKENKVNPKYGKYESQRLGTQISKITVDGKEVKTELDNTVLKVYLPKGLKSGESIKFNIDFKTYFDKGGDVRRRMKIFNAYGYKHYDGVHWYPRISVYDNKFGWSPDQHLGREFYGNFGTYDVELTFANNFILDATGNLINRNEVLPSELLKKLDIRNFKDKPLYETPSVIIPYDSTIRKTWKFHAENVHDFAFTSDPTYRIGEAEWNGIKTIALAQEPHASRWQNAAEFAAKVIQVYSEDIGMYAYPKMIVADAQDGMEYPMLTLDGGFEPDNHGLLAHEIAHNWFYGMVASNETYRAFMDEGFTQFLTSWSLRRIEGEEMTLSPPASPYVRKFKEPANTMDRNVYSGYMADAILTSDDACLNTHSDQFGGALRHGGGYRQVYYKTATMLYNLQYVLGDSLFWNAMQHYFNQWKFAHPYPEDFRNSIINYTKVDLNWFFDQWLETTKKIDYKVKSIKKGDGKDNYLITFKRKERMQMPLDFDVIAKNDSVYSFHIPNNWFEKQTTATILPRWIGWDILQPNYTAQVSIPWGIKNIVIDPTERLADVYMLNNSKKTPVSLKLDHKIYNAPSWKKYELFARPDVWYNGYDGIKAGFHVNGNYFNKHHIFDLSAWYNTGILQNQQMASPAPNDYDLINFRLSYKTSIDKLIKKSNFFLSARSLDGLRMLTTGVERFNKHGNNRVYSYFKTMVRPDTSDTYYLLFPNEWIPNKFNNTINFGMDHNYFYQKGKGMINLNLKSSAFGDYDYSILSLNVVNYNKLGKFDINTRTFAQFGAARSLPRESALYLYGANPEELMENKYTRSAGIFPPEWGGFGVTTNHFHHGGGLNLRGYSGYVAPAINNETDLVLAYKGLTGAAFNIEIEFDRLIALMPRRLRNTFKIDSYLFADAGVINTNLPGERLRFDYLRADAGIGTALTIKKWGPLQMVNPLTIRFDVPFFINRTPAVDPEPIEPLDYIRFRWVIAVSRAF
ncbi:MAG: M1 family metallopeptidase [Bacteroidetes bacterium]|nr:M1 family metallopeptidase [Bacteroidota bacterium]HET6244026.1 M1 family metallopeptidase [Bacteroidia bacterium]